MGNEAEKYGWHQDSPVSMVDKLKTDLKTSMKQKDNEVRDAIRLIMAEFPRLTVPITLESGKKTTRPKDREEITNEDIIDIVRGLVKSEKTVLEAKRENSSAYLVILMSYLPKMAGRDEIESWIRENIELAGMKSPMQAMGPIMKHFGKTADGGTVRKMLEEIVKGGNP